ncbi:hypothetical protein BS78_10G076800 [Paspalum vaginatum]|nr:hypothetical protein BS78_10G076800 [Paspalum vaginatum]
MDGKEHRNRRICQCSERMKMDIRTCIYRRHARSEDLDPHFRSVEDSLTDIYSIGQCHGGGKGMPAWCWSVGHLDLVPCLQGSQAIKATDGDGLDVRMLLGVDKFTWI